MRRGSQVYGTGQVFETVNDINFTPNSIVKGLETEQKNQLKMIIT